MISYWAGLAIVLGVLFLLAIPKTLIDGGEFWANATRLGVISYYDRDSILAELTILPRAWRVEWLGAPPMTLWFVVLLLQYYLLFPPLLALAKRFGIGLVVVASFTLSIGSGILLLSSGFFDGYPHAFVAWCVFRLPEFTGGMAFGWVLAAPDRMRAAIAGPLRTGLLVVGGVALYLAGSYVGSGRPIIVRYRFR